VASAIERSGLNGPAIAFTAGIIPDIVRRLGYGGTTDMATRDLVLIGMFAAIIAALGLLPPLPLGFIPVPITAQTLGVMLSGAILGARRGGLAVLVFLVLVVLGMPLLAGGRGGLGVFLGPSGGFLIGFPIGAYVIGWIVERAWERINVLWFLLGNLIGGIAVIYAIGIPWLSTVAHLPLAKAAILSAAFLPGDLIKAGLAAIVASAVQRAYPMIRIVNAGP
jgi:biotin transport system substrate-specific component